MNNTLAYQCQVCGDMNPRKLGEHPTVCYSCAHLDKPEVEVDMNAVEEYIQGDHGYVISSNR